MLILLRRSFPIVLGPPLTEQGILFALNASASFIAIELLSPSPIKPSASKERERAVSRAVAWNCSGVSILVRPEIAAVACLQRVIKMVQAHVETYSVPV